MSLDATRWAWSIKDITPSQKITLLSLADRAGESHKCWPSIARIEVDTCLNKRTIMKVISELEDMGLLKVSRVTGQGNVYQLCGVVGREDLVSTGVKNSSSAKNSTGVKNSTDQCIKLHDHQCIKLHSEPINEPTNNQDIHTSRKVEICRLAKTARMYGVNPSHLKLVELSEKHGGYPSDAIWEHAFAIAHNQGGGQFGYAITTAFGEWQKSISRGANKPVARKNTPSVGAGGSNPYEIKPEGVKYVGRGIEKFEQPEEEVA